LGGVPHAVLKVMSVIHLDNFRQSKQRQYMRRYRSRLEQFIRARVQVDSSGDLLRIAEYEHHKRSSRPELVWDYVEMRDVMLEFVSTHVATEIYDELRKQFWFDESIISKDMVAERCLSLMILGPGALAAE
jgi:hypothetical protein